MQRIVGYAPVNKSLTLRNKMFIFVLYNIKELNVGGCAFGDYFEQYCINQEK